MSWSRIHGHADVIDRLKRAVRFGRLAHAYLFVGPSGIGKRAVAAELAKALLCENATADRIDACDHCSACKLVDAGTHPDIILAARPVDKLEFAVEHMRELCRQLSLRPVRGRRRIAIVDDADDFNAESANTFLKTLEEPEPGSLLILLGTAADIQLPTIRSRCQLVVFAPLGAAAVAQRLRAEGVADESLVQRLVAFAEGSPGRALNAADPALWAIRDRLVGELAKPTPDATALARDCMAFVDAGGKEAAAQRSRAEQVVAVGIDALRRALNRSIGAGEPDPLIDRLAARFGPDGLIARMERLLEAEAHIDRRVQVILLVEAAVDALCLEATSHRLRPAAV